MFAWAKGGRIVLLIAAFAAGASSTGIPASQADGESSVRSELAAADDLSARQVSAPWTGSTINDLWKEYSNIFRYGNRNAASHLWTTFLLERSAQMTPAKLELMFSGFCAVSGSPVRSNDYNRYMLSLDLVSGKGKHTGAMHYCCWPCVCDTQDFIRVDTKTVPTSEGPKQYHFAVIGNPCDREEKLHEPFVQPFFGRGETTIANEAREVRCEGGRLLGATMSDHGYVIISMFFDIPGASKANAGGGAALASGTPQPGRVKTVGGVLVQDEFEWGPMCLQRAANGYNSGMGEIFRKVAGVSPIVIPRNDTSPAQIAPS